MQRSITARDCPTLMLAGSFLADASTGQPSPVGEWYLTAGLSLMARAHSPSRVVE
ncbi:MAG: hypothetical protein WCS42_15995 [Verrucomicrobiota bacterium]